MSEPEAVLHVLRAHVGRLQTHPCTYGFIRGDLRINPGALLVYLDYNRHQTLKG